MLVEEFKRCIQSDVKIFLDEEQVETLEGAARLADDYYLTHKVSFIAKPEPTSSHSQNKFMSGNSSGMPSQSNTTSKVLSLYCCNIVIDYLIFLLINSVNCYRLLLASTF